MIRRTGHAMAQEAATPLRSICWDEKRQRVVAVVHGEVPKLIVTARYEHPTAPDTSTALVVG